jgi:hypothetical protein
MSIKLFQTLNWQVGKFLGEIKALRTSGHNIFISQSRDKFFWCMFVFQVTLLNIYCGVINIEFRHWIKFINTVVFSSGISQALLYLRILDNTTILALRDILNRKITKKTGHKWEKPGIIININVTLFCSMRAGIRCTAIAYPATTGTTCIGQLKAFTALTIHMFLSDWNLEYCFWVEKQILTGRKSQKKM